MKSKIHVFSRMFARLTPVNMLLFILFAVFATANATQLTLETDAQTGEKYVNMSVSNGSDSLILSEDITSFKVYDDGGKTGNYASSQGQNSQADLYLVAPEGFIFQVTGSVTTLHSDYLTIYGNDVGDVLASSLGSGSSASVDVGSVVSMGDVVHLKFFKGAANSATSASGLDLTVTLSSIAIIYGGYGSDANGGYATCSNRFAKKGEKVTVTINANDSYAIYDVAIWEYQGDAIMYDIDQESLTYKSAVLTFNMPNTGRSVAVIPIFEKYDGYVVTVNNPSEGGYIYNDWGNVKFFVAQSNEKVYFKVHTDDGYLLSLDIKTVDGTSINVNKSASSDDEYYFDMPNSDVIVTPTFKKAYTVTINNPSLGGAVLFDQQMASVGELVSLTISDSLGILDKSKFKGLSVLDGSGNEVYVSISYDNKTATFTMPASNVIVKPEFERKLTAEDGLVAYMSDGVDGSFLAIPDGVKSFKVRDNSSEKRRFKLSVNTPTGYVLQMRGTVTLTDEEQLFGISTPDWLVHLSNPTGDTPYDIGVVYGKVNDDIYFTLDKRYALQADVDITVDVVNGSENHKAVVAEAVGGTLSPSEVSAKIGELAEFSVDRADGYVLSGFEVKVSPETALKLKTYSFLPDKVSFKMPGSDVTVIPSFTNKEVTADEKYAYVEIPEKNKRTVEIPANVKSFNVRCFYAGSYCAKNADGSLQLTVPEGKRMQLRGTTLVDQGGHLVIYDGSDGDEKLIDVQNGRAYEDNTLISSGNTVTFDLKNGDRGEQVDFTVIVFDQSETPKIEIASVEGGTVSASADITVGKPVTLNISPKEGFWLKSLNVVDAFGNFFRVRSASSFAKTATFMMPASNVTVTPTFTDNLTAAGGLYVYMPFGETTSVTVPTGVTSFKVTMGDETNTNADSYLELISTETNKLFQVTARPSLKDGDSLTIFDGNVNAEKLLSSLSTGGGVDRGGYSYIGPLVSSGPLMTIKLKATDDYNRDYIGNFVVTVGESGNHVVKFADYAGGMIVTESASVKTGSKVNFSIIPDEGYVLKSISAKDDDGRTVVLDGASEFCSSSSFTMGLSDVTITPVFEKKLSAKEGLEVNIPSYNETRTVNVPLEVTSLNVDLSSQSYGSIKKGCLVLNASEGFILSLNGYIRLERTNEIVVYDGLRDGAKELLHVLGQTVNDISEKSSGNVMTFCYDGYTYAYSSMYLPVTFVDQRKVRVAYAHGGSVSSSNVTAVNGENVTLTATPARGFLFEGLSIVDAKGNRVEPTQNVNWTSGATSTVTFTMPETDYVTVTSRFVPATAPYATVPVVGVKTVNIPEGLNPFRIYDDGGETGKASKGANGTLLLKAPEDNFFIMGGSVKSAMYYDFLTIYDGNNNTASKLWDNAYGILTVPPFATSGNEASLTYITSEYEEDGFKLNVSVGTRSSHRITYVGNVVGGSLDDSKKTANSGETITLIPRPAEGYILDGFEVVDKNGNPVEGGGTHWYSLNPASFVMPFEDVTVTPKFTAIKDLYINIPGDSTVVYAKIPKGVNAFKVYDHGGKDNRYKAGDAGAIEFLYRPGNLQVTGKMSSCEGDETTSDFLLAYGQHGPISNHFAGKIDEIPMIWGVTALEFFAQSEGCGDDAYGIDLTVTVIDPEVSVINPSEGGTVTSDKKIASMDETVTLTANPAEGYYLSNISFKDVEGFPDQEVAFNDDVKISWVTGKATFTMPSQNVYVYPSFASELSTTGGLFVKMPSFGKFLLDIPASVKSFKVSGDAIKSGMTSNSDAYLVMTAPEGYQLQVTGSMNLGQKGSVETLTIYDGEPTTGTGKLMDAQTGKVDEFFLVSSGNVASIYFKSSHYWDPENFNLTVSLVEKSATVKVFSVAGGSVTADKKEAEPGDEVTLTITPDNGHLISDIKVVDANGEPIELTGGKWYSESNKATFTMPATSVSVVPAWTDNLTADGDNPLYVNMLDDGTTNMVIPSGVTSFKVYDNGGKDGPWSCGLEGQFCYGTLVIKAPMGYLLSFSGEARMQKEGNIGMLQIYDGIGTTGNKIFGGYGNWPDISHFEQIISSGEYATIMFRSYDIKNEDMSGLNLKVELAFAPVHISSATGGSMTADNYYATDGETVTLTATPDEGYLFDGVKIEDADGQKVMLVSSFDPDGKPISYMDDVHWYYDINTAKFIMPSSAVTVTPVFTKLSDLYVNMPKNRTIEVHIPESVASFKVYDDGGDTGNYSDEANGTLELIPTDGWTLNVAGKAALMSGDVFKIQNAMMVTPPEGGTPYLWHLDYFYENNGSSDGKEMDIEPQTVSQVAVVSLVSDDAGNAAGISLTVTKVRTTFGAVGVAYVKGDAFKELCNGCEKMAVIDSAYKGTDAVSITDDIKVDKVIYNRKFIKDTYSTMVLPFSVKMDKVSGVDAVLYYNGIGTDKDGNDAVRMKVLWATSEWAKANDIPNADGKCCKVYGDSTLNANTPYLVQMNSETFQVEGGVTIVPTTEAVTKYKEWEWEFRGTWQYKKWEKGNKELGYAYGFAASAPENSNIKVGDFVKIGEGTYIYPLRAYLVSTNIPESSSPVQGVRANGAYVKRPTVKQKELPELMSVIVDSEDGNEEHTTVIGQFNTRTGEFKMNNAATKRMFDVKGRNVGNKANKARGAYYGKKVR